MISAKTRTFPKSLTKRGMLTALVCMKSISYLEELSTEIIPDSAYVALETHQRRHMALVCMELG